MDGWMDGTMDGWMDGWIDRQTNRATDMQTYKQTIKQTDRQTPISRVKCKFAVWEGVGAKQRCHLVRGRGVAVPYSVPVHHISPTRTPFTFVSDHFYNVLENQVSAIEVRTGGDRGRGGRRRGDMGAR